MRHKRSGIPSKGFVVAMLRRHFDQRVEFRLTMDKAWKEWLGHAEAFDVDRPVYVNAIFQTVVKRPRDWPAYGRTAAGPTTFFLVFRDCLFKQDGKQAMLLSGTRKMNKRRMFDFELTSVIGWHLADQLRATVPQVGYTREGSITQGGSKPGVSSLPKDSGNLPIPGEDPRV